MTIIQKSQKEYKKETRRLWVRTDTWKILFWGVNFQWLGITFRFSWIPSHLILFTGWCFSVAYWFTVCRVSLLEILYFFPAMVFPVVMYRCECWTIKKAERQKIDAFELWWWRRLLRVPWTSRRSVNPKENQSWIFIGRTDAEAPILWPPDAKSWVTGKDPNARKDWGKEKGQQRMRWLDSIIDSMDMSLRKLRQIVKDREAWCAVVHRTAKSQTLLSDWTTIDSSKKI